MRDYEVVYILKSSLTGEEIEDRLDRFHQKILAQDGAEITAVEHWGKRQLAYLIDGNENGYYVVAQFTAAPTVLPEYERVLKLDDSLLRHLVVLSEGQLPTPPSVQEMAHNVAEAPAKSSHEDGSKDSAETETEAADAAPADVAAVADEDVATVADEDVATVTDETDDSTDVEEVEVVEVEASDDEVVEEDTEEETVRSEEA